MKLKKRLEDPKVMRRTIIKLAIIVLLIFSWLIYLAYTSHGVSSRKIIPEYQNLFTQNAKSKLNVPFIYESQYQSLSCNYRYDDKFYLSVSKLIISKDMPLSKLISEKDGSHFDFGSGFSTTNNSDLLHMDIKDEKVDAVSKINIYLKGDSITKIVQNDTLLCYYLKAKKFSLLYNNAFTPNIVAEAKHENTPVSILFLKKGANVYVFLMDIINAGQTMKPDLLYSLIEK